ncbi:MULTISPECIES: hypothetical protein [unclassified Cobetia]|nr:MULTISPECIES: hypothetical protein [unclassified Cobetia]
MAAGFSTASSRILRPQSRVAHHWSPPLGASLGFMIGMLGDRLVG